MHVYKSKDYIQNLNNYDVGHQKWINNTKLWFYRSLNKNFHTNINYLNSISYQIADIMLIHIFNNKPITTIQEAQIIGCSQATISKTHYKLSKAKLLELQKRLSKQSRNMKFIIRILWNKISELDSYFYGINKLSKILALHSLNKKLEQVQPEEEYKLQEL